MSDTKLSAFQARDEGLAGTVSVGDGEGFDVGEALVDGDGLIVVVAGSRLEYSLDGFLGLKRAEVPDGAEPVNPEELPKEDVTASDAAKDKASELGVDLSEVDGTGKGGTIKVSDVEAAASAAAEGDGDGGGGS